MSLCVHWVLQNKGWGVQRLWVKLSVMVAHKCLFPLSLSSRVHLLTWVGSRSASCPCLQSTQLPWYVDTCIVEDKPYFVGEARHWPVANHAVCYVCVPVADPPCVINCSPKVSVVQVLYQLVPRVRVTIYLRADCIPAALQDFHLRCWDIAREVWDHVHRC